MWMAFCISPPFSHVGLWGTLPLFPSLQLLVDTIPPSSKKLSAQRTQPLPIPSWGNPHNTSLSPLHAIPSITSHSNKSILISQQANSLPKQVYIHIDLYNSGSEFPTLYTDCKL
jgi:hypothetical protein